MQPMQVADITLDEDDEDEDGDTFGGGGYQTPQKAAGMRGGAGGTSNVEIEEEGEEMNTFGLSDHEIEKKILFRKSEKDRTVLIAENKRLREIINSVDISVADGGLSSKESVSSSTQLPNQENIQEAANVDDGDLRGLINELNAWDIERDELDGQIDNLNDKKDELKRKIVKQKEKKMKKVADKEHLKLSMMSLH